MTSFPAIDETLSRHTLECSGMAPLDYYRGGNGADTIAIIQAYGQSLGFWEGLIPQLAQRYRILIWQARGSLSEDGGMACAHPVEQHVRDLRALLDAEGVASAHLLGWCTGPKTALAFYDRHPSRVSSIMCLTGCFIDNPAFKPRYYTRYELAMAELCRMVSERPQLAPQLMEMFKTLTSGRRDACGSRVAALVPAPFRAPDSIVEYARQLLEFWNYDIASILPRVAVPTLFVGGERDDVTHPWLSREMAMRVPDGMYLQVRGGDHYLHIEQPALLAKLIADFIRRGHAYTPRDAEVELEKFPGNLCGVN